MKNNLTKIFKMTILASVAIFFTYFLLVPSIEVHLVNILAKNIQNAQVANIWRYKPLGRAEITWKIDGCTTLTLTNVNYKTFVGERPLSLKKIAGVEYDKLVGRAGWKFNYFLYILPSDLVDQLQTPQDLIDHCPEIYGYYFEYRDNFKVKQQEQEDTRKELEPVVNSLLSSGKIVPKDSYEPYFMVEKDEISTDLNGQWMFVNIVSIPIGSVLENNEKQIFPFAQYIVGKRLDNGNWQLAVPGDPSYQILVNEFPSNFVSDFDRAQFLK
jgi:hypothetical protein